MSDWDSILEQEVHMLSPYGPADGYETCTITCPQNDGEFAVTATCAADHHVQAGKCVACAGGATRDKGDITANGNTHCSCGAGRFAAADAENCAPHTECSSSTEYESVAPTPTSNRECAAVTAECPSGQSETVAPTSTSDRGCAETVCTARTDDEYRSFGCIVPNPDATTFSGLGTVSSATGYSCTVVCSYGFFALDSECVEDYHVQGGTCAPCSLGTHNAAGDDFYNSPNTTCDDNVCTQKTNAEWIGLGCSNVSNAISDDDAAASVTVTDLGGYKPAEGYATCAITCPDNDGDFEVTATCAAETHYTHSVATAAQVCTEVRECAAETQYESAAPTPTSDRGCTAVTAECIVGQYESAAATPTSDRGCKACTTFGAECTECSVSGCTLCSSGYYPGVSPGPPAVCTSNPRCHAEINQDNCTAYTDSGLDHSRAPTDTGCAGATCTLKECCTPHVGCSMSNSLSCGGDSNSWSKHAIGNAEGGFAQCSGLDPASCKPAECCTNDASGGFAAVVMSITGNSITVVVPSGELKPEPGGMVRYPNGLNIGIVGIVSVTPTPSTSRARRADVAFNVDVDGAIPVGTQRVEVHPKAQPTRKSKKTKKAKTANSTVNSLAIIGGVLVVAVAVIVVAAVAVRKRRKHDYITLPDVTGMNTMGYYEKD